VQIGGTWGVIDKAGKLVIPASYDRPVPCRDGLCWVAKDGQEGYVDTSGKVVYMGPK
jgi:hypothetical protein